MAPKRPAPNANRKPGEEKQAAYNKKLHNAQRTIVHNALKNNGERRVTQDSDAYDEIMGTYGVRNTGQSMAEVDRQLKQKERQMLSDAQAIRDKRNQGVTPKVANRERSSRMSHGTGAARALHPKEYGSGATRSKPAGAGSGATVDRSDAIKRAWATRKKMYGSSGKKASS